MFASEAQMSKKFDQYLKTNFGSTYFKEYSGLAGIPDFILYSKNAERTSIISFELKLCNWRQAARQAFRHKTFAHIVYVVLDANQWGAASAERSLFEQYNIGLAVFDRQQKLQILYKPFPEEPYSSHLKEKFISAVSQCRKKTKNVHLLAA